MKRADPATYLADTVRHLRKHWPDNRTVNIVCHGHSVPAGYFATPVVDTLNAYPHLMQVGLKHRFPFAVTNVVVTAIGGEDSEAGAARLVEQVLTHRPDVLTLDYGLNDRRLGRERARRAWAFMIQTSLKAGIRVILLTPTFDMTQAPGYAGPDRESLAEHADQIRGLADEFGVGLADSFASFQTYATTGAVSDLLSWGNHPNRLGHELVARELLRWFPADVPSEV